MATVVYRIMALRTNQVALWRRFKVDSPVTQSHTRVRAIPHVRMGLSGCLNTSGEACRVSLVRFLSECDDDVLLRKKKKNTPTRGPVDKNSRGTVCLCSGHLSPQFVSLSSSGTFAVQACRRAGAAVTERWWSCSSRSFATQHVC